MEFWSVISGKQMNAKTESEVKITYLQVKTVWTVIWI